MELTTGQIVRNLDRVTAKTLAEFGLKRTHINRPLRGSKTKVEVDHASALLCGHYVG